MPYNCAPYNCVPYSRRPDLLQPVSTANPAVGLRNLGGLLAQLGVSELQQPLQTNEVEWVFGLTGMAGSYLYMAPEVFDNLPYNEKSDVFSFGVLAYELLAGELLSISIFNTGRAARMGVKDSQGYAAKVAQGYRPARSRAVSDAAWSLIESCWQQDPVQRPTMAEAEAQLRVLLGEMEGSGLGEGKGRGGGGGGRGGGRLRAMRAAAGDALGCANGCAIC
ncbi:hypothetical protein PLESTB_000833300 [Pleodorina starrii]|uniref:Protein kinase domain-containing protein n=1 Tax=Pleodorina starrii TaxID=330485 RepID=A0A9W6BKZ1_9CHLO|nr:hypothetical protein PLESTB_000833300 [Pleodorina starrii]GLC64506.1 hypothetical protein PLESTF_000173400 [Pleodorina starrii]